MGNLIKNIRQNQRLLCAVLSAILFVCACQPVAKSSNLNTSPNARNPESTSAPINIHARLAQEVYIWQRQWRPANQTALVQSQGTFKGLRILALQAHPKPNGADIWFEVAVNHAWLQADPRPKVAVIRLDGQLNHLNDEAVINKINQVLNSWREKGTHIAGVEIDHDSASSKLPAYRNFLKKLKAQLPADLKLSITALPAWLSSTDFPALLTNIDELVLQIHSVSDPRLGLFDAAQGWQWVQQLSSISTVPYLIALPTYGSAVISTASGYKVESETPLRDQTRSPETVQELQANPQVLQTFVQRLQTLTDDRLRGIIWFRLPLEGDKRVWPLNTLIAVAKGEKLSASIELAILDDNKIAAQGATATANPPQLSLNTQPRLFRLSLVNRGNIAVELPNILSLAAKACSGYDAQNGYRVTPRPGLLEWQLRAETPEPFVPSAATPVSETTTKLNPGGQRVIGWARCESLYLQGIYAQ
ncbi:DUF3142 domain-containing protein [Shewanella sp. CG12_big_fil_rev_8_21_14_0_65_47_15]|uniref:DUF3142 domain-containing protein n=1 Tax=Shewanella sp. CG12_big_fil_rev_8_21_14_0_65_47_15 TaxID=1975537 RepID=UPI000CA7F4FA|nr:DUF3142 domain-containing protein [Shewanella sp. CG12_big_fil_rev_8_21_14_0_65_47_15]PIW61438.1 MAG: DUF3142 domain-containing protein [Shewanella sp. CG12_big_fil_rev_8_21_14_0_65_47_15]